MFHRFAPSDAVPGVKSAAGTPVLADPTWNYIVLAVAAAFQAVIVPSNLRLKMASFEYWTMAAK